MIVFDDHISKYSYKRSYKKTRIWSEYDIFVTNANQILSIVIFS